jgi:hypothetical protein
MRGLKFAASEREKFTGRFGEPPPVMALSFRKVPFRATAAKIFLSRRAKFWTQPVAIA